MTLPAKLLARPESEIQRAILDYLATVPGWFGWRQNTGAVSTGKRFVRFAPKGCADIVGCHKGRFVAIEVKRPGRLLTADQVAFSMSVGWADGVYIRAEHVEDVRRGLEGIS